MDKILDSGSSDGGSIPLGDTILTLQHLLVHSWLKKISKTAKKPLIHFNKQSKTAFKIKKFAVRILLSSIFLILFLAGCREDFAFKKETNFMDAESRRWIFDTGKYTKITFINQNKSKLTLPLTLNKTDFTPTRTTVAGIPTHSAKNEVFSQFFEGNGGRVTLIATAYGREFGNIFSYAVKNTTFRINIFKKELIGVENNNQYFSSNDGSDTKLKSTFNFQKDYNSNGVNYPEVLVFELKDGVIDDKDVFKAVYAPNIGLIYYKTKGGEENWRIVDGLL
jgi:hypothetical protein